MACTCRAIFIRCGGSHDSFVHAHLPRFAVHPVWCIKQPARGHQGWLWAVLVADDLRLVVVVSMAVCTQAPTDATPVLAAKQRAVRALVDDELARRLLSTLDGDFNSAAGTPSTAIPTLSTQEGASAMSWEARTSGVDSGAHSSSSNGSHGVLSTTSARSTRAWDATTASGASQGTGSSLPTLTTGSQPLPSPPGTSFLAGGRPIAPILRSPTLSIASLLGAAGGVPRDSSSRATHLTSGDAASGSGGSHASARHEPALGAPGAAVGGMSPRAAPQARADAPPLELAPVGGASTTMATLLRTASSSPPHQWGGDSAGPRSRPSPLPAASLHIVPHVTSEAVSIDTASRSPHPIMHLHRPQELHSLVQAQGAPMTRPGPVLSSLAEAALPSQPVGLGPGPVSVPKPGIGRSREAARLIMSRSGTHAVPALPLVPASQAPHASLQPPHQPPAPAMVSVMPASDHAADRALAGIGAAPSTAVDSPLRSAVSELRDSVRSLNALLQPAVAAATLDGRLGLSVTERLQQSHRQAYQLQTDGGGGAPRYYLRLRTVHCMCRG